MTHLRQRMIEDMGALRFLYKVTLKKLQGSYY